MLVIFLHFTYYFNVFVIGLEKVDILYDVCLVPKFEMLLALTFTLEDAL